MTDLSPRRSFGYRLWMLRHAWTRRLEGALQGTGLTHMQFFLMRALEQAALERTIPSQTHLADALLIDRMTVSSVLRTLEGKGFVIRGVHPDDPRANCVSLTDAGAALLDTSTLTVMAEQERFFGRLGPEGKTAFSAMLDQLLDQEGTRMFGVKESD